MYTVGIGMIPYNDTDDDYHLTLDICFRPDISEICDTLLKWWSVYHKYLTQTCLEFLSADNRNNSKFKNPDVNETKDIILLDNKDLEPSEFIDFIVRNHLVKYINLNELSSTVEHIESDHKIKLAYQITEGIKYLHGENILHQDLHSKNIVIHQNNRSWYSKKYRNRNTSSFGVSVPYEYMKLYQSCWNCEPDERPSIEQIVFFNIYNLLINSNINQDSSLDDLYQYYKIRIWMESH
ncbi:14223_t:CDS:2 [Rhizophagus irregularis]|nr:14223_t:CDS:2 [Rhizophagus irregularis]